MRMNFEELDDVTRRWMLVEFEQEQAGTPFISKRLEPAQIDRFLDIMRAAIQFGNEESLYDALLLPDLWRSHEPRGGRQARVNILFAAEQLSLNEFNTWYVRGLARRLLEEGERECQIYRAAFPQGQPTNPKCSAHENKIVPIKTIYDGHRAKYHPRINPGAFSIPAGPGCHHTIRRVPDRSAAKREDVSRVQGSNRS